jgi:hypothetical protein
MTFAACFTLPVHYFLGGKMNQYKQVLIVTLALMSGYAMAKLPAPTPEQQAAAQQKKAQEDALLEKEKEALTRVQDKIAEHYRRTHPGAPAAGTGQTTQAADLPKAVKEGPGQTGPIGGRAQSAESHSGSAK